MHTYLYVIAIFEKQSPSSKAAISPLRLRCSRSIRLSAQREVRLFHHPSAVHAQVDTIHATILEEEYGGMNHICDCDQPPHGSAPLQIIEYFRRLVYPSRRITDLA